MASVYRVRGGWRCKWHVDGKEKTKLFPTRTSADRFRNNLANYIAQSAKKVPSVREVATEWLVACERGTQGTGVHPLEHTTLEVYRGYVANHFSDALLDKDITEVKRRDVMAFRDTLLAECASRTTAKKILGAFRSVLKFALDREYVPHDVSSGVTIKTGGRHRVHIAIPTKHEMRLILTTALDLAVQDQKRVRQTWARYAPMLELLVYCGLRLSELRGLPRSAIDLTKNMLHVRQRADRHGRIGPPKSVQGRRSLYIPAPVVERLDAWLHTHNFDLVFPSRTGSPLAQENIRKRMWVEVLEKSGVRIAYNLHATRHFFASRMIESGANPKEVSAALGHADEGFTLRVYGHLFKDAETEHRRQNRADAMLLD